MLTSRAALRTALDQTIEQTASVVDVPTDVEQQGKLRAEPITVHAWRLAV